MTKTEKNASILARLVKFTNTFAPKPLIFALDFENSKPMYLKFIRHKQPCGEIRRGTLYNVHFQPNEKGGYNEYLTTISDAYEIPFGDGFPLPLIYPAGVVRINGFMRLTLGDSHRRSALHLIDPHAREAFFSSLLSSLRSHDDIRIEVCKE